MITEDNLVSEMEGPRKVSIDNSLSSLLPHVDYQQHSMWAREGETQAKPVIDE